MPDTDGRWATTRFVDPADCATTCTSPSSPSSPAPSIPFAETHVMEHGLYVLEGKAVYRLNQDWVEVEAGDFMWLRAFCPQACYAGGPGSFRYLLYKDVNRHAKLGRVRRSTPGWSRRRDRAIVAQPLTREGFRRLRRRHRHRTATTTTRSMAARPSAITIWRRPRRTGPNGARADLDRQGTPYEFPLQADDGRAPSRSAARPSCRCRHARSWSSSAMMATDGPGEPHAFLTQPGQGVNYPRNLWHGVLTPIGEAAGFPGRRPRRRRHQPRGVPFLATPTKSICPTRSER